MVLQLKGFLTQQFKLLQHPYLSNWNEHCRKEQDQDLNRKRIEVTRGIQKQVKALIIKDTTLHKGKDQRLRMMKKGKMHKVWWVSTELLVLTQTYEIRQSLSLTRATFSLLLSKKQDEYFTRIMWILTYLEFLGITREWEITQVERMNHQFLNLVAQPTLTKQKLSVCLIETIRASTHFSFERLQTKEH